MSLHLKSRRVGTINRKVVSAVAVFALIVQPVAALVTSAEVSALSNGPFSLATVCESEKVVLKLQAKQEVSNWVTGNVIYQTPFGQTKHDLSKNDVDTWSVSTGQSEVAAGVANARVTGAYFFGVYDKTFTINYPALNCDVTAPNAPVFSLSAAGVPLVSGESTSSRDVAASWTNGSDDAVKYEYAYWNSIAGNDYKENSPWVHFTSDRQYAGAFTEGEGVHFMKVRAFDKAGNVSPWSNIVKVTYDTADPVLTIHNPSDGKKVNGTVPVTVTAQDSNLAAYSYRIHKVGADDKPVGSALVNKVIETNMSLSQQTVFTWDTTTAPEGKYFVYASARDTVGKRSEQRIYVTVDNTTPTVTIKPESKGTAPYFQQVSFKLYDANMIDKVTLNGVEKDLSNNVWSDLNNVKPGVFGAVEGSNTLIVYDVTGNTSTFTFTLDTTKPTVTIKGGSDTIGNGPYRKVSFKLFDTHMIDKAEVNGKSIPLTDNIWSDLNNISVGGAMGGKAGTNTVRVYDVSGNVTEVSFILDNSVVLSLNNPSLTNSLSPIMTGVAVWNIGAAPAAGIQINLTLNNSTYTTFTDENGEWTFDDILPLTDGVDYPYEVTAGFNNVSGSGSGMIRVQLDPVPAVGSVQSSRNAVLPVTVAPAPRLALSAPVAATDQAETAQSAATPEVLGAETQAVSATADKAAVAGVSTEKTSLFNFWWIIAALVAIGAFWWIIAAIRRKRAEQEA